MNNEIGFNSEKLNFFTMPPTSQLAENLDLYKMAVKNIDVNCVKCAKPLTLEFNEKLMRCPFCSDFFKPHAQLIFQIEEKIQELTTERPVSFYLINKWIKISILVALFIGFTLYEDWISIGFLISIFGVLIYELYTRTNQEVKRFKYLTKLLEELESTYQNID